jgi:hypothetical protein
MHRVCILISGFLCMGLLHRDHLSGICLRTACGLLSEMTEHILWLILQSTDQLIACSAQGNIFELRH